MCNLKKGDKVRYDRRPLQTFTVIEPEAGHMTRFDRPGELLTLVVIRAEETNYNTVVERGQLHHV